MHPNGPNRINTSTAEVPFESLDQQSALGKFALDGTADLASVDDSFSVKSPASELASDIFEPAKQIYAEIDTIFSDPTNRPKPETMRSLILSGASEEDFMLAWKTRGHEIPNMDLTFEDLASALPYIGQISDRLASTHCSGERMLFAGRDADSLYDYFTIANSDIEADLLPASGTLWHSSGMQNNGLARRFLSSHLLDEQSVIAPSIRYRLIDTGFQGNILTQVVKGLKSTYGKRRVSPDKFSIELVCANDDAIGAQILEIPGSADELQAVFPKVTACLGPAISRFFGRNSSSTVPLAVSLQLMPRYHGPYQNISETGNQVTAVPKASEYSDNVDTPYHANSADSTIINPLAAALVQYRVVSYAMAHNLQSESL